MKKIITLAAILVMALMLTACSGGVKTDSDVGTTLNNCAYSFDGMDFKGTYTGDAVSGVPNGKGKYTGTASDGSGITASGTWKNGVLNEHGSVDIKYATDHGIGMKSAYFSGQFVDNVLNGDGSLTIHYTDESAASNGISSATYDGQFINNCANGQIELTVSYTFEYTDSNGIRNEVIKGQFKDADPVGQVEVTVNCSPEYAFYHGFNRIVAEGTLVPGTFDDLVSPYTYKAYSGDTVVSEGVG